MSFDNKNGEVDLKKTHEELASNYALQVALQTMKERCQQLQSRLSTVEDENLQLKIEKQKFLQHETNVTNLCDIDKLQEQIAQLNRQKSQLTHHIYMVATENKHLWTRLSLLTEANESLGTRLNKISNTLSTQAVNKPNLLSNEEYSSELTDMSGVKNFDFPLSNGDDYSDSEEEDNPALISLMMQDLKLYKEQFLQCLSTVKEQQNLLRAFYSQLKEFYRGYDKCMACNNCSSSGSSSLRNKSSKECRDVGISVLLPEQIAGSAKNATEYERRHNIDKQAFYSNKITGIGNKVVDKERICPICGATYPFDDDFNIFLSHVQQHFQEEDEDYHSDSLLYDDPSSII